MLSYSTGVVATALVCLGLVGCATGPTLLAADPPSGTLHPGEIVFVDDGTCPAGQVKQIVGGSNRAYSTDIRRPGVIRQGLCVPRP